MSENYIPPALVWTPRPHCRWLIRRDMLEVMRLLWEEGIAITEEQVAAELRQRNVIGFVCEIGERIDGVMLYELHKKRLHITLLAGTDASKRRLIQRLKEKLTDHRRNHISVEVDERALEEQRFWQSHSFLALADGDTYLFTYYHPGDEHESCANAENAARGVGDSEGDEPEGSGDDGVGAG